MKNHHVSSENINFTPIYRAKSKWWIFRPRIEYPTVGFLPVVNLSWYSALSLVIETCKVVIKRMCRKQRQLKVRFQITVNKFLWARVYIGRRDWAHLAKMTKAYHTVIMLALVVVHSDQKGAKYNSMTDGFSRPLKIETATSFLTIFYYDRRVKR